MIPENHFLIAIVHRGRGIPLPLVELEASKEYKITRWLEKETINTATEKQQKKESKLNLLTKYYRNVLHHLGGE